MKYKRDVIVFWESLRGLQRAEREKLWEVVFQWAKNIFVPDKVKTLSSLSTAL
jgi:hypothetical protein